MLKELKKDYKSWHKDHKDDQTFDEYVNDHKIDRYNETKRLDPTLTLTFDEVMPLLYEQVVDDYKLYASPVSEAVWGFLSIFIPW